MLHCVSYNVKNIRREKFSLCEKMWKMKILANEKKIVITRASEKRERGKLCGWIFVCEKYLPPTTKMMTICINFP